MKRGTLNLTLVTAALIAQTAGAEIRAAAGQAPPPFTSGQTSTQGSTPWGTKKGCNPFVIPGESQPRCWDDNVEAVIGGDRGNDGTKGTFDEVSGWLRSFDLVIVVDRATQHEKIYKNQGDKQNPKNQLIMDRPISTGANDETRDCDSKRGPPDSQGVSWVTEVEPEPIYRHTPTGYFVVRSIKSDYFSRKYESEMPLAVTIEEAEGTYNHVRPKGTDGQIGHKASHGCIREEVDSAAKVYAMVATTGTVNPADDNFRAHCWHGKEGKDPCDVDQTRDRDLQNYAADLAKGNVYGFNWLNPKAPIDLGGGVLPRARPYTVNEHPDVLVVHKNGTIEFEAPGSAKTSRDAFNTLYIVKDSTLQTGAPFVPPPQIPQCTVDGENAKIEAAYRAKGRMVTRPGGSSNFFEKLFSGGFNQPQAAPRPPQRVGNR